MFHSQRGKKLSPLSGALSACFPPVPTFTSDGMTMIISIGDVIMIWVDGTAELPIFHTSWSNWR